MVCFGMKCLKKERLPIVYLVVMLTQYSCLTILGGTTIIKLVLLTISPLLFVLRVPYVNKALLISFCYLGVCCITAFPQNYIRFSTLGFMGMYLMAYVVFYNLIYEGTLSFETFCNLLRFSILLYGIVLFLQQLLLLLGITYFPMFNLSNQQFLSLTKLPSLSLEPSHSARLLTVMMLSYLRCLELRNGGGRVTVKMMFEQEHRWVTVLFLWAMLTMGSGTAFIGLGLLCLYFIRWQTVFYMVSVLAVFLFAGQALEIKQLDRALRVAKATMTGDIKEIQAEDGSAASRIIPIVNTLRMDLTEKETWLGKGTSSYEQARTGWMRTTDKIAIVEQYGLIALILSLLLVYSCMIRSFFCLETLVFLILFGMSLTNVYYVWGTMMIFTAVRYFQQKSEKGILVINDELYEKD